MKNLIHEMHRRSLWQVVGIYAAGSWISLQVVNEVVDSVALPEWISGAAIVLLIVGFPIVIGTAFVQEGVGGDGRAGEAALSPGNTADTDASLSPQEAADSAPERTPTPAPATEASGARGLLTWRNAVVGGVVAFALLGLATAGYITTRTMGVGPAATLIAQGVFDETDRILLADFTNRTADSLLAGVVTEALRVDLAQSDGVKLTEQNLIAAALDRMERAPDTPIDPTLGRLLAQREGIKAVLVGEIGAVGSNYSLTAQVIEPAEGEILFSHRETADGDDEIIDAINRLSRRLRERLGESLGSLRTTPPLERVTTSDLEALRLYTQAVRAIEFEGDDARGISMLEEAIAIDTAFAAAYRKIGVTLGNRFEQRARMIDALTKAHIHRDRLTSSERYMAIAAYNSAVTGDEQAAVTAFENLLENDPGYYPALNNLGILYYQLGNPARAEELYLEAARVDRSSPFPRMNAVWPQAERGGFADADAGLDSVAAQFPGYPMVPEYRGKLRVLEGDYEAAESEWLGLLEARTGDLYYEGLVHELLGASAAARGQLALAERELDQQRSADVARDLPGATLGHALSLAWLDLLTRRDTSAAAARLSTALEREGLEDLSPADRPYLDLADFHAMVGDLEPARAYLASFEEAVPPDQRGRGGERAFLLSRAQIAISEGRTDEALELIREGDSGGCRPCAIGYYADAFERAGMVDSLIAVYERYVDMTWVDRVYFDSTDLPLYLERLGQLYDERGDLRRAAEYYARFVELWADADDVLQPRVNAAQARLDAILQEIG